MLLLVARAGLCGAVLLAMAGLVDPGFRPTEIAVRPDQVSHAMLIYAITLLGALSFPHLRIWVLALVLCFIAVGVEIAQLSLLLPGAAQPSDVLADLGGGLAAIVPLAVLRGRRRARASAG